MRTAIDVVLAKPEPTREELVSMCAEVRQPSITPNGSSRFCWCSRATTGRGSGLGLTLVSSIAAAHHATVHATAVPTGGLDVTVRFPRRESTVRG